MMKKTPPAASPDAYVKALRGWRGKRLTHIEPRLKGNGKYELRTVDLREGDAISTTIARRLTREAVALNKRVGDPTKLKA